ncbi:hypothetical protein HAZT_HAZT002882 [Hyalella azteca]|uniref:Uncharacterized protein n=1 Tax=Hyalella azteca TaxID=294128 RepID=A0A6A0GS93_HYAAZ|nr:hypothetical protein HAZT_HAZT002882 [Hyalella azteca]
MRLMSGRAHGRVPSLWQLAVLVLVSQAVTQAVPEADAKRFDCRLFCKETGFHAMLGGCRCSFTLFTAKRALRGPYEEEGSSKHFSHLTPRYYSELQDQQLTRPKILDYPTQHHKNILRMTVDPQNSIDAKINEEEPINSKRREFEMDLDNGEPADFLRMSY